MASGSSPERDHERGESQLHALRRVALEDESIERIEGEEILVVELIRPDLREAAALRRIRIDIIEMLKIGRVGEIAERGQPVGFDCVLGAGGPNFGVQRTKRPSGGNCEQATT